MTSVILIGESTTVHTHTHTCMQLAGILRPYDGQCYLERDANTTLPIEYRRWDEFVSSDHFTKQQLLSPELHRLS